MTVKEKIELVEREIAQLKSEQSELSNWYNSLKDEFRSLIDKMNAYTNQKNKRDEYILQRLESLRQELETLKSSVSSVEGVNIEDLVEDASSQPVDEEQQTTQQEPAQEQPQFVEQPEAAAQRLADAMAQQQSTSQTEEPATEQSAPSGQPVKKDSGFDFEKFIGENLISKLGILILLVGVAIGGKYAIDHDLISPAMRIVLGCLVGVSLLGVAYKLKPNYEKFSAVLCSGGWATLYFMTYFAYGFYGLINMPFAFVLMMLITVCTVYSAWWYDRQIIAVIGQVGAYVIPFVLSTGEGNVFVLLAYIAIIDLGILIVSVKKYWRTLFVFSYVSSWIIMLASLTQTGSQTQHSLLLLLFTFIFFAVFYATVLVHKYVNGQLYKQFDVFFLLSNAFLFFGIGFHLVDHSFSGVFTLCNALLHLGVFYVLGKRSLFDSAVRCLVFGLVVLFITLAILVWFSGHWITMFWMLEAAILFFVARKKQVAFYEYMSYPLFIVALLSLFSDWGNPGAANNVFFSIFFEIFFEIRDVWDSHAAHSYQGAAMPYVNTLMFIAVSVAVVYIDRKYPATYPNRFFSGKRFSSLAMAAVFCLVTCAVYVHFPLVVRAILWPVEAVAILYLSCRFGFQKGTVASFFVGLLALMAGLVYCDGSDFHLWLFNLAALVFVVCNVLWLFLVRKNQIGIHEIFVDLARLCLILHPLVVAFVNLSQITQMNYDDRIYCCFVVMLCYLAVFYYYAHRNCWENYTVKLMALLRIAILVSLIGIISLTYDLDNSSCRLAFRYILVAFSAFSIYLMLKYRASAYRLFRLDPQRHYFLQDTFMVLVGISILSLELVNICSLLGYENGYKLLLSIFLGICSLALVYFGLVKKMKYIRIEGIVLFAFTLVKLFFLDISHLSTISKTIVFMALGALLLVISFFYQKIAKEQENSDAAGKNSAQ